MKWLIGIFTGGGPSLWVAIAVVLAATVAWGGIGWYGKSAAENDLLQQQLAGARVITAQLEENQRLSNQNAKRGAAISDAFQKGRRDAEEDFKPIHAEVAHLRGLFPPAGGLRQPAPTDGSPLPVPASPAGGPNATACTHEPGRVIEAADRVVEDLAAYATVTRQLIALQTWVRDVCAAR